VWFFELTIPQMLHHPVFFGWVGAILKSLYWLQYQINKGLLRPRWFTYFMIAPPIGVILGGIAALVVNVGFRIANAGAHGNADWKTVALIAAFAGFNWEWALEKFRIGADAVSSRLFDKRGVVPKK
jgi:asparagine N-glycosylation enzyme membrane subunit Stt3